MKLLVTTVAGDRFEDVINISGLNKKWYADKHGYDFFVGIRSDLISNWPKLLKRHPTWTKIPLVIDKLQEPYDWIFWTDADSVFTNGNIGLESIIDDRYDLIIGSDYNGINAGHFLVKNSEFSREFFWEVWNDPNPDLGLAEQGRIIDLYPKYQEHIQIVAPRVMNSYDPVQVKERDLDFETNAWHPGDLLIHFAGGGGDTEYVKNRLSYYSSL